MSKKKITGLQGLGGLVYSTDPNFSLDEPAAELVTPEPDKQQLRVQIESKHRGGKTVSVIKGFEGRDEDLQELAKKLKNHCGTGGTAKDGEIIIQGDNKAKIIAVLIKWGYKAK